MKDPIEEIKLTPVFIPFSAPVRQLMQAGVGQTGMALDVDDEWLGGDFLICEMITQSGLSGWGEVFVWTVESGVSPTMMADFIAEQMARYVLGRSGYEMRAVQARLNANIARNDIAKGLLDLTLYDLAAKAAGVGVADYVGGAQTREIPLAVVVPLAPEPIVLALVNQAKSEGINSFRLKLGESITQDEALVKSVREAVGPKAHIRVDYNQAYSPQQAVAAINAIAPYGIDFAEQPVNATDFAGMAHVQSRVDVPVMAHEGAFGLQDNIALTEMGGVRAVGINPERPGGFTDALRLIDYARMRGMDIVLHNQPTGLGSAQLLHLHAARAADIVHATELQGHVMLEHDLLTTPIDYSDGLGHLPEGPGWGVSPDRDAIDRYATGKTRICRKKI